MIEHVALGPLQSLVGGSSLTPSDQWLSLWGLEGHSWQILPLRLGVVCWLKVGLREMIVAWAGI